jgi:O-antigen ligase
LVTYGLLTSSGELGLILFLAILVLGGALVVWARSGLAAAHSTGGTAIGVLLCVPGLLVLFFSFTSGGFFPDSVATGAVAVAVLLVVRLGLADNPLASYGPAVWLPLAGIVGLSGWGLLSQVWSHAPGRADVTFDRDLLYALTFALFASVGRTRERLSWAVRGVALVMVGVAAVALLSKVAPDVVATTYDPASLGRLAYPLTYWNALGAFCAVAAVLCVHLAAADERRLVRVLGAAALPVLGATLLLTYSRGGLGVAVVGLVLYVLLGRPRGLLSALVATAPTTAIAMKAAYDATLLSTAGPATPAATHQGHHLGLIVIGCVGAAVVVRGVLLLLDAFLEGERSPLDRFKTVQRRRTGLGLAVVAVVLAVALGAPGALATRWNQFVNQQTVPPAPLIRERLSSTSNQGRIELWKIALNTFDSHPLDGTGADTYAIAYYEHRKGIDVVDNAHSLYLDTLAELGIVGLLLLALFVLGTLAGLAPFRRGRDRALYAALFSAGLAWALHAGVDWDWQMPAASLWFAALGGLALARPDWRRTTAGVSASLRALVVGMAVVAAAVLPALVLASQLHLNNATEAYSAGSCTRADQLARQSIDILGTRAGPWQIEALCDIRAERYGRAEAALRSGLAEDPHDWQLQSALAGAIAAGGGDGRSAAAIARRLDPNEATLEVFAQAIAAGPSARARAAARVFLSQQSLIDSG